MLHDLLTFGVDGDLREIANTDRAVTYAKLVGFPASMMPRRQAIWGAYPGGGGPYETPKADLAPWYEAGIPESEGFAGIWIESVTGNEATYSRGVQAVAGTGGSFTAGRFGPRTQTFTVRMIGAGELQLEYGLEWLTQQLLGKGLDPCATKIAGWLSGDPKTFACHDDITDMEQQIAGSPVDLLRRTYDVNLTGTPTVVNRWNANGCTKMYTVTFQLAYGSPYVYANGCAEIAEFSLELDPDDVRLPCCDTRSGFIPPCYAPPFDPTDLSRDNCWDQPLRVYRNGSLISPIGSRRFSPIVEITAGTGGFVRNLRVAFYERRPGDPEILGTTVGNPFDPDDLYECARKLSAIEIPYIPASSVLTFDARTNSVELVLASGEIVTRQVAQGENGSPITVPSSDGASEMYVVIEADAYNNAVGGTGTSAGTRGRLLRCDQFLTAGGV